MTESRTVHATDVAPVAERRLLALDDVVFDRKSAIRARLGPVQGHCVHRDVSCEQVERCARHIWSETDEKLTIACINEVNEVHVYMFGVHVGT